MLWSSGRSITPGSLTDAAIPSHQQSGPSQGAHTGAIPPAPPSRSTGAGLPAASPASAST